MTIGPNVTATFYVPEPCSQYFFKFRQGYVFVFEVITENKTKFIYFILQSLFLVSVVQMII